MKVAKKEKQVYGTQLFYGPTDFKSQTGVTETIFSPELVRQWDAANLIGLPLGINYAASSQQSTSLRASTRSTPSRAGNPPR